MLLNLEIPHAEYLNLRSALVLARCDAEAKARQAAEVGLATLQASYERDAAEAERLRILVIRAAGENV
jgi:hypothetical protein